MVNEGQGEEFNRIYRPEKTSRARPCVCLLLLRGGTGENLTEVGEIGNNARTDFNKRRKRETERKNKNVASLLLLFFVRFVRRRTGGGRGHLSRETNFYGFFLSAFVLELRARVRTNIEPYP